MSNTNGIDIESAMNQPKKYQVDGEAVESHSLDEMIKADQYLAKKKASKKRFKGIKLFTISTQGASD